MDRIDLTEFSDPLLERKPIQDEFFGVYCLVSRSELKAYKNRCYIGYTVDPHRRINQHNLGQDYGGARKTDNRGPWEMVCIIHGFPNSISALRFEWAWQNPEKSKRLKQIVLEKKSRKESQLLFKVRVACYMLNCDPWRRLALTFRWMQPEFEVPFPVDMQPPQHVRKAYGLIQLTKTIIPSRLNQYTSLRECYMCKKKIEGLSGFVRCSIIEICGEHFHSKCMAERSLSQGQELELQLFPIKLHCPKCNVLLYWSDLIKDQQLLISIDNNKAEYDGLRMACGLIPCKMIKK